MTPKYIFLGLIVAALIGLGFASQHGPETNTSPVASATTQNAVTPPTHPHLEIVRGTVHLEANLGQPETTLASGAEILPGSTLKTDAKTSANVLFADGSSLRIDENSTVTITSGSYDSTSGSLVADILLASGRVWSKIVELATPDSSWQVKTPHAVATVRGTAFATSYLKGKTSFSGSEHTVRIRLINPKTKQEIPDAELTLSATSTIELKDADVSKIILAPLPPEKVRELVVRTIPVLVTPPALKNDPWVKESLQADTVLNTQIDTLKTEFKDKQEFRAKLQEKILETHPVIEPKVESLLQKETPTKGELPVRTLPLRPITKDAPIKVVLPARLPVTIKPIETLPLTKEPVAAGEFKIVVGGVRAGAVMTEGDTAQMSATIITADGTKRDITKEVTWRALGGIGSVSASGLFSAKLDDSVSENGEAKGTIAAIFKDPKTGSDILAHTEIFTVEAAPIAPSNEVAP